MTCGVHCKLLTAIRLSDIDAGRVPGHALDHLDQHQVFQREHSEVAITACSYDPMLFGAPTDSESGNVVDLAAIEPKHHIGVDLFDSVLVVTHDVIIAPMRVDLTLNRDALLDLFEALIDSAHWLVCTRGGTCYVPLLVRR